MCGEFNKFSDMAGLPEDISDEALETIYNGILLKKFGGIAPVDDDGLLGNPKSRDRMVDEETSIDSLNDDDPVTQFIVGSLVSMRRSALSDEVGSRGIDDIIDAPVKDDRAS